MARDDQAAEDREFEQRLRRALKTPPISNEEIERRSKLSKRAKPNR
jgi:hypothetical protein